MPAILSILLILSCAFPRGLESPPRHPWIKPLPRVPKAAAHAHPVCARCSMATRAGPASG